ncbi:MAG: ABC transporter substrate-binding protein [Gordonia sp. (in: high G+C Gram-positive bacteria)]
MSRRSPDAIDRRRFLGGALTVGGATLLGGGLAACASSSTTPVAGESGPVGTPKSGGVLKLGVVDGNTSGTLDAHKPLGTASIIRGFALYSKPWVWDSNMSPAPALAEETETDASARVWTIRLRQGAEFHNGKTIDADDLIFSIRRLIDPKLASPWASLLYSVRPGDIDKLDNRTVRLRLTQGFQPLKHAFTNFGGVVPVDYDPLNPVGAGPFKYKSFTPGQRSVFVRHPNYWEDGKPYADELHIIEYPDDTTRVNALASKQINLVTGLSADQVRVVASAKSGRVVRSSTQNWVGFSLNTSVAPFTDVRVRQAFRLIADRDQLIAQGHGGAGKVANDLYSPNDPTFDTSIPQRKQDIAAAKALLRAAGLPNLAVTLTTTAGQAGEKAALVFAQQAKEAGVTVRVDKVDSSTFNGPRYLEWPFATTSMVANSYLSTALQTDAPISTNNVSHFSDRRFGALFDKALATPDEAQRTPLVHQMQQIQHDSGGLLIYGFRDNIDAVASNIGGVVPERTQFSVWRFEKLWVS